LNKDYNHDLKSLFKGAATRASVKPGPLQEFYQTWPHEQCSFIFRAELYNAFNHP
jgi:hypothetical protein